MRLLFKSIVVLLLAICLGYQRYRVSRLIRTKSRGSDLIFTTDDHRADAVQFLNRTEQRDSHYFTFKHITFHDGPCGNLSIAPKKRICTPSVHVHPEQREFFTLLQGQLGYQLGEKIDSCNVRTCSMPIVVDPMVPHSFWMDDNQEDLIVMVRLEPTFENRGLSAKMFENIIGARRDGLLSIWQAFVFVDYIEAYAIFLPFPVMKIFIRTGALIGSLLGYQTTYDEYTTVI